MTNLAAHDSRTRGHCERVRVYNDLLAEQLGLSRADRDRLRWAALIHDIGKLKVSHRLLNKPGQPTVEEWAILRAHPARGAEIVAPLGQWLGPWAKAIEQHHERWDGTGYPRGLTGVDINLGARIVAVADAFEVMTSLRPYGRPVTADSARAELAACAGTHFDPLVVRAFLDISIGPLRRAMGLALLLAQVPLLGRSPKLSEAARRNGPAAVGAATAVAVAAVMSTAAATHGVREVKVEALRATHATPPMVVTAKPKGHRAAAPSARSPVASHPASVRPGVPPSQPTVSVSAKRAAPPATTTTSVQGPTAPPPTTPPTTAPTVTAAVHGRCAGNAGRGLGNGGPTGSLHGTGGRSVHQPPLSRHAVGLHACA
jgi:putative nucleotidyltransferase with HDIG domain